MTLRESSNPPLAYSLSDASRITSISRSTLYNLSKAGKLTIRKVCGRSLVLHDDLIALICGQS